MLVIFGWLWEAYLDPPGLPDSLAFALAVVLFGALMIVAATVGTDPLPPVTAGLVFLFGVLALRAGLTTFGWLHRGELIQFDSNWGGLGGGMGGWRLSPTAATAALALIFASTAVAVAFVGSGSSEAPKNESTAAATKTGGTGSGRAAAAAPANTSAGQ